MDTTGGALTKQEAEARALGLSVHRYDVWLDLTLPTHFQGRATVTFSTTTLTDLWLDIDSTHHSELYCLEVSMQYELRSSRLYFAKLPAGQHSITVKYRGKYRRNGTGLHRFVDPMDQSVYLYSYFCPYFARAVFPCFDQPDLKASLCLQAKVRPEWKVYSNVGVT